MLDRTVIPAIKALVIAVPLWLILIFAAGEFTWRLLIVGAIIFAAVWILLRGKAPRPYDTPPSPDEWWWNKWGQ